MGFYYFILLFLGILMAIGGPLFWKQTRIGSGLITLFGIGFTGLSIFLFQPESSEIIARFLGWT